MVIRRRRAKQRTVSISLRQAAVAITLTLAAATLLPSVCMARQSEGKDAALQEVADMLASHIPPKAATPELIVIPLRGIMAPLDPQRPFDQISPEMVELWLDLMAKREPCAIVLSIDSPGGYAPAAQGVTEILLDAQSNRRIRVVAWPQEAGGPAALACLSCKEILARPTSTLGSDTFNCFEATGELITPTPATELRPHAATRFEDRCLTQVSEITDHPSCVLEAVRTTDRELWWRSDLGFAEKRPPDAVNGPGKPVARPNESEQETLLKEEQIKISSDLTAAQRRLDQAGGEYYADRPDGTRDTQTDPKNSGERQRRISPEKLLRRERLTKQRDDLRSKLELNRRDLRAELVKTGKLPSAPSTDKSTGTGSDRAIARSDETCTLTYQYDSTASRSTLSQACNVPFTHKDGQGLQYSLLASWNSIRLEVQPKIELIVTSDALKPVYDGPTATLPILSMMLTIGSADPVRLPCSSVQTEKTEFGTTEILHYPISNNTLQRFASAVTARMVILEREADVPQEFAACATRLLQELEVHRKPVVALDPAQVKVQEWICLDDRAHTLSLTGTRLLETGLAQAIARDPQACVDALRLPPSTTVVDMQHAVESAKEAWRRRFEKQQEALAPFTEKVKAVRRNLKMYGDSAAACVGLSSGEFVKKRKSALQRQAATCRNAVPSYPKAGLPVNPACEARIREALKVVQTALKSAASDVDANLPSKAVDRIREATQAIDALMDGPCI